MVEKDFYERIKPIKVDYIESVLGAGFSISSNMPKPATSCGSSCSC
ncbi:Iron-sulfur cluster assembly accessory protein (fragment) [uncultured Desulfobacterium sp.]|uniref:Iron-sulfur cluster assembly accessory protein n=1 Tax=uncultured Desulfobacterium sp. TaxID=201089 RepID=A0A445MRM1_9BACT